MPESVVFKWNHEEFQESLDNCPNDDGIRLALSFLPDKSLKILEAGCGNGRVIKYLYNLGYVNICGIEVSAETVGWTNLHFPELQVSAADILQLPYEKETFDAILSFGVVEHFPAGPKAPLTALYRVLKKNGIAVVTVPSYNILRKIKNAYRKWMNVLLPDRNPYIRNLLGKKPRESFNDSGYPFHVFPQKGPFLEYRFTPKEFEAVCIETGFRILNSIPIAHADGLYHELGWPLIRFFHGKFILSSLGSLLNYLFLKISFFHNHMHACVLSKKAMT